MSEENKVETEEKHEFHATRCPKDPDCKHCKGLTDKAVDHICDLVIEQFGKTPRMVINNGPDNFVVVIPGEKTNKRVIKKGKFKPKTRGRKRPKRRFRRTFSRTKRRYKKRRY